MTGVSLALAGGVPVGAEAALDELDLIHAVLDEWLALEDVRSVLNAEGRLLSLSSTFRLVVDRYAIALDEVRRGVRSSD